ncbi:AI-2E family transporter [Arenibacterium sp. CAU 1754]
MPTDPAAVHPQAASQSRTIDPYDRQNCNRTIAIVVSLIGVVLLFFVLDQAQDFFAPVLAAFVLGIVLSPLSKFWQRIRLRPSIAAFATLTLVLMSLIALAFLLEPYVSDALESAPVIWSELREAIEGFRQMLRGLDKISEDVAATVDPSAEPKDESDNAVEVPTLTQALFYAPHYLAQFMVFSGTLYFFLLARHDVYRWVGGSLINLTQNDFEHAEEQVARYFLTITTINAAFGVIVAFVMQMLEMPAPIFWGMSAFLFNFLLYLGPITLGLGLLVTGLVAFDGAYSVLPAALYLSMNAMEGQFITPMFVGHRMSVNPLLVFLSLIFWLWLWGPIGGIIAIPLMIWVMAISKAVMDQTISSGIPGMLRPNRLAGPEQ